VSWRVVFSGKAAKMYRDLPEGMKEALIFLMKEIEILGPVRGNWKNYGKLGGDLHHCHLKSGRPTYVACWRVLSKTERFVEVYYVGTHEKAPY
jgi:hypothetical protein